MENLRGSFRQIRSTGEWIDTVLAVVAAGKIITLDKLGDIYVTDPITGECKLINNEKYTHSKFLFGVGEEVFNIDKDGTLYGTKVSDGSWRQISEFANYPYTSMGVNCGENIVTVGAKSGRTFLTSANGEVNKISEEDYSNTVFIFGGTNYFFTIENNNLYRTNPIDGVCKKIGETGAYANTKIGIGMNDKVYTLETTGVIWETDGETGEFSKIIDHSFLDTQIMFAGNNKLYAILPTGCLYEITI